MGDPPAFRTYPYPFYRHFGSDSDDSDDSDDDGTLKAPWL